MIAVDTNLLIYSSWRTSPFHEKASEVVTDLVLGNSKWSIPWPCIHEFISISTHPKIFEFPVRMEDVFSALEQWINSPTCITIGEGFEHFACLQQISTKAKLSGPMIHDARIAAICLQHQVSELWTVDRDFSRFPSLKTRNPLVSN
jgi:toxin-antitoxin system PIN domain toxin